MANEHILVERQGHILTIGLNRPEKMNALSPEMFEALREAYTELDEDPELRAGVLYGVGKHMNSGLELTKFLEGMKKRDDPSPKGDTLVDPFALGRKCTKPVICAVQGITYTAGLEMMLAADIAVAASDVRFSQLEPKRGLMAIGGGTFRFVQRAGWGNAMYHLLRCDEFGAEEALRIGIIQEVVQPGEQKDRAIEIAKQIAKLAPLAIQATKQSAMTYIESGEAAAIKTLGATQSRLANTEDAAEGLQSFIERREGRYSGR